MLEIECPHNYVSERRYICQVLFWEYLGLPFKLKNGVESDWVISRGGKKKIRIADILFKTELKMWLKKKSLPQLPVIKFDLKNTHFIDLCVNQKLPAIYVDRKSEDCFYDIKVNNIDIKIDIFGSCFFMLTCYEEVVNGNVDIHGRYPSKDTIAYKYKFLERPIVNEYLEILWFCINKLWPDFKRKKRNFKVRISHDVDRSYLYHDLKYSFWFKQIIGDLLFRKSPYLAIQNIKNGFLSKINKLKKDPFDTYDWLMDISERNGIESEFYFLCGGYGKRYGPNYKIDDSKIINLIRRIHARGHKIGIHPSYQTYLSKNNLEIEVKLLIKTMKKIGIPTVELGGRQHYYRWHNPTTWQLWEDNGLQYDSSLAFEDLVGFRCGTCYEFPVFNLKTSVSLKLIERPLIINEDTLFINNGYSNLTYEQKCQKGFELKKTVRKYNGVFETLWHNDGFYGNERLIKFYENILMNSN